MKTLLVLVVTLGLAAGGVGTWYWNDAHTPVVKFRTAKAERDVLVVAITANGTLEPEEVIDVGAQVVGRIKEFGRDPKHPEKAIDHGTFVEEGTVLAQIDDATYQADVEQARANLRHAEADLIRVTAKLDQAERDWNRTENLHKRNQVPAAEVDQFRANLAIAKGDLAVTESAIEQAKAALRTAEISLGHTTIRSPIKGIVLDRRVNVGQTVVSSLNAPSLFLIAKDLKKMEVWASVNEADIGNIYPGQGVRFTVDAYPNQTFDGKVLQIRLNATMSQNVVTYTVVISTDNSGGKLLPYLTANLQFEVARRTDALLVPNSALRWRPTPAMVPLEIRGAFDRTDLRTKVATTRKSRKTSTDGSTNGLVWVVTNEEFVRPLPIKIGLTDGTFTEVLGGDIEEGTEIVVGETRTKRTGPVGLPFLRQLGIGQEKKSEKAEAEN